jgi:hypothetical protein
MELEPASDIHSLVGEEIVETEIEPVVVPAKIASDVRSLLDKIKSRSGDKPATSAG